MDDALEVALKAAKDAKRAAALTVAAVAVAVLVLVIDQSIKRAVLDAAAKARESLEEHRKLLAAHVIQVRVGDDGNEATGETRAADDSGGDGPDGVVHDAPARSVLGEAADAGAPAPASGPAGTPRGPRGDGRRTRRT